MRLVLVDNVLLERNGSRVEAVLQPHLGLISLVAVLRASGHESVLYDPKISLADGTLHLDASLYAGLAREILALEPDAVGLTSLGCNFICTLKIARHLKALAPEIPILLGGPHATILDRRILERYGEFDLVVRHEAEETLPAVLRALRGGDLCDVPGITFRREGVVHGTLGAPLVADLDALPMPAYDAYPIERLALDALRVEAGRGCPFSCTFCSTATFFGRRYRLKSAMRLRDELDALAASYGIHRFSLQHDLFTVNRDKVLAFCDAVGGRGYEWNCSARMDCVDASLLAAMAKAGCRQMYFGVETGSPYLQAASDKRLDLNRFYPTLRACEAAGIAPTVSFITGYPQERAADQAATLDVVGSCFALTSPPEHVQLHLMTPEPGTALLAQFGDGLAYDGFATDATFPLLEDDDAAAISAAPDVFVTHHYFAGALSRERHVLVSTLYDVLHDLSPVVIAYVLDHFDGRLSLLADAFERWASPRGIGEASGPAFADFCAERFERSHPLTSLVRYRVALASLPRKAHPEAVTLRFERQEAPAAGAAATYALNPHLVLLDDIADGPRLLAELERAHAERRETHPGGLRFDEPPAADRRGAASLALLERQRASDWSGFMRRVSPVTLSVDVAARGDYALLPIAGTDEIRVVRIAPEIAELLKLFTTPRSRDDRAALSFASAADANLRELLELDAIVPLRISGAG